MFDTIIIINANKIISDCRRKSETDKSCMCSQANRESH